MPQEENGSAYRYSVSLVTQGHHKFYTLTMPSDVLAKTCFVTTREEDPRMGFQRLLDRKRAEEIANYIDNGLGTIPNSIVLSAQPDAELRIIGRGKTLEFKDTPKAFLILDGQHRVYGFSLAKTSLRVPVVIYNGLNRRDESRLFIDINTKQRPVPNELLLDIKSLAEYETSEEQQLRGLFDKFNGDNASSLLGQLSPAKKSVDKISRSTFNAAVRPLLNTFIGKDTEAIFQALNAYVSSYIAGANTVTTKNTITNPTIFRAVMQIFPEVAQRVKDKFEGKYDSDNFYSIVEPIFKNIQPAKIVTPGRSYTEVAKYLERQLKKDFTL